MTEQRLPWLCRIFGHRWTVSHVLMRANGLDTQQRDVWAYYAHTCTRCWHEEKRNLWPTL